jgi:hypothetical protein
MAMGWKARARARVSAAEAGGKERGAEERCLCGEGHATPSGVMGVRRVGMVGLGLLVAVGAAGCENRVTSTRECLGNGGISTEYDDYVFEVDKGPALDVGGNCHVVLNNCTVRAPEGIRAGENAVVTVRGGSVTGGARAVAASGNARVTFEGTVVVGAVEKVGGAVVSGVGGR